MIFIDMQGILDGVDHALIDTVFTPLYWRVRVLVPPLRLNRNWVVLLYRRMIFERSPDSTVVQYPPQTLAEWNEQINNPRIASMSLQQVQQRHVGPAMLSVVPIWRNGFVNCRTGERALSSLIRSTRAFDLFFL